MVGVSYLRFGIVLFSFSLGFANVFRRGRFMGIFRLKFLACRFSFFVGFRYVICYIYNCFDKTLAVSFVGFVDRSFLIV